ncbi:hypothetical protein [Amycolatopsis sp. lyj-23]|uniref:hypothetical protein n=1 Tax=Amycolatopsis sp. lyj-23 TaxID=2789283 RepID=UPI00397E54BF
MRIQTKRILQVALASGGLLAVGSGVASAESIVPGVSDAVLGGLTTNPGMHNFADAVNGVTAALQPGQAVSEVVPAAQQRPAPAAGASVLGPILHAVPLHLLQQGVAPSAQTDGDQPEHDLNAPLGSELSATELPALPATLPLTADAQQERSAVAPVGDRLPLHAVVSPESVVPAGTRVTGLQDAAAPVSNRGTNAPAGLPLVGSLLPATGGLLPMHAPTLTGVPDLTQLLSLGGLTQLAGSTPLTQGGLPTTGVPLAEHGPASPAESATALTNE